MSHSVTVIIFIEFICLYIYNHVDFWLTTYVTEIGYEHCTFRHNRSNIGLTFYLTAHGESCVMLHTGTDFHSAFK
jgi:hypothetical protein